MPDQPYTAREGWIDRDPDHAPMWSAGSARMWPSDLPCLVVTGDLDVVRRRLDPPPTLPSFRKVAGTCPACSGITLMLGAGDHVTCSWIGCPDPMAARRRLDPPAVSDDARTRGIDVVARAECDDRDGPCEFCIADAACAVDALLAAGWAPPPAPFNPYHTETGNTTPSLAPPPAPASDDVKARATSAVRIAWATEGGAYDSDELRIAIAVDALAAAGLLRGPETSSAAPEGAALSASGTVRRAGGPDHGTAPVGDAVPDASAITFAAWVAAMVGGRDA